MKLLTFTTLYPDAIRPGNGVFVENRLRHLLASGGIESRVVAPVPWFPIRNPRFGRYASFAAIPTHEIRHGIRIIHPRYLLIPKIGMTLAPFLMAQSCLPVLKKIIQDGYDFDAIDAHYFYPDGVAAAWLGRKLGKPVVITARGTDINLIPRYHLPRRMILWASREARAVITVCQALKDSMIEMGVAGDKITVLRNGVDLKTFQPPDDRQGLRARLGFSGRVLLSVGYLIPRKGHDLVIQALPDLPNTQLWILGEGPERESLKRLANRLGVADRVQMPGAMPHSDLVHYYGAADALVLASSREGWANVLLESMACGTPVIATPVWGTPEVVAVPQAGRLTRGRSASAIVEAVQKLFAQYPDRSATRSYAESFSWTATTQGQRTIFSGFIDNYQLLHDHVG